VSRLRGINRFLLSHRRATSLVGVVLVLGVAGLNAHAALPEHHFDHHVATMCVASLAMATLAAIAWPRGRTPTLTGPLARTCEVAPPPEPAKNAPDTAARAGPPAPLVLRI
jgi:hypothetical protein